MLSPDIHCKLDEPMDTRLSQMHSINSDSLSSARPELGGPLIKNSLEMFINISKIFLMAESYSVVLVSGDLFLHFYVQNRMEVKRFAQNCAERA